MKRAIFVFVVGIFSLSVFMSFANTPEEELLKRKELKLKNYQYEAKAGDRKSKMRVLEEIYNEFDSAKYSENDKKLLDLADYLSGEGSARKEFENNMLVNDFPEVRKMAVKVLSKIGGTSARQALLNALNAEPHPTVKAEICLALARPNMADTESGDVMRSLSYMYRNTNRPDPNLVFALIEAVESIAKANPANNSDAIYLLSEIQHGDYNKAIRQRALDAIISLSE